MGANKERVIARLCFAGVVGALCREIVDSGNAFFVVSVFFELIRRKCYGEFAIGIGGYSVGVNVATNVAHPEEPAFANKVDADRRICHRHAGIGDCLACNHHVLAKVVAAFWVVKCNLECGRLIFAHLNSLCTKILFFITECDAERAVHAVGRHNKFAADASGIVGGEGVGGNGFVVAVVERNRYLGIVEQLSLFCAALKDYCRVFHCFARAIDGKVGESG